MTTFLTLVKRTENTFPIRIIIIIIINDHHVNHIIDSDINVNNKMILVEIKH